MRSAKDAPGRAYGKTRRVQIARAGPNPIAGCKLYTNDYELDHLQSQASLRNLESCADSAGFADFS
jgi:hypothetical protein